MMKKLKQLGVLLTMLFVIQNHVQGAVSQAWLDNKVKAFVKHQPVKAIIYGLWVDGKPVSINSLGDSMTAVPATKLMHFRIGGVTETLLTSVLMKLAEQNKLGLDDKVARWFPKLPNASEVTLRMLANGMSGYPDYVYNKKFIDLATNQPFKHWSDRLDFSHS